MATSGLHRSWWTLVYARSGNRLRSVQPCGSPRPSAPPRFLSASPTSRETRLRVVAAQDARVLAATKNARGREYLKKLQGRSTSTGLGVRESCRMLRLPSCLLAFGLSVQRKTAESVLQHVPQQYDPLNSKQICALVQAGLTSPS